MDTYYLKSVACNYLNSLLRREGKKKGDMKMVTSGEWIEIEDAYVTNVETEVTGGGLKRHIIHISCILPLEHGQKLVRMMGQRCVKVIILGQEA